MATKGGWQHTCWTNVWEIHWVPCVRACVCLCECDAPWELQNRANEARQAAKSQLQNDYWAQFRETPPLEQPADQAIKTAESQDLY